jgi:sodium transport system permease protein
MATRPANEALPLVDSLVLLAGVTAALATLGGLLQQRFGSAGLVATELALLLAPTVAVARWARVPWRGIGLSLPSARSLAGGALAGAGGFYLGAALIEPAVERLAPLPPSLKRELERLIVPQAGARPLVLDLLVLALAPAVCEELLFRGALLMSWRRALPPALAAVASALAFAAFHLSLYKLLPLAALGLLAAALALRARSVAPAIALHFTNNALVVVFVRAGREPPPVSTGAGLACLACSVAAIAAGWWLASPRRRI